MTQDFELGNSSGDAPVISIQCDWDDVLFSSSKEVWVSCKFRGKDGFHSKLRRLGQNQPSFACDKFTVISCTKNALHVKHNPSGYICAFVPDRKTFSNIHKNKIMSLDVTEGGLGVSVCSENKLAVWNLDSGEIRRVLEGHPGSVYKCKFFPSGIVVLSGGSDMQLKIWSAETGECPVTLIGHKGAINDFCIVDRGRNIISVSKDGTAKLWDCGKSACLDTIFESTDLLNCCSIGLIHENISLEPAEPVSEREIGTDKKVLLIGSEEGNVYGVSIINRKTIFTISTGSAVNVALYFSKDKFIVGCQNGRIDIYSFLNTSKPLKTFYESNSPVLSGCVYKQKGFFIGRNDGIVSYYDCETFSDKRILLTGSDCDPVYEISCSHDKVFTACRDGKVRSYCADDVISNFFTSA